MSEEALTPAPVAIPGWYGKMPHLGDFVSRRLPEGFIQRWDAWLQGGLASAQAELGSDWLGRYLVAPVYRFWIAPGVLDGNAWAGVLMPSVDAVGRYFPLTIALAAPTSTLHTVLADEAWFDAIDAVARQVLDEEFTAEDLDDALAQIAPLSDDRPADAARAALADELLGPHIDAQGRQRPCSIWWTGVGASTEDFDHYGALPPADALAALLTSGE